MTKQQSLTQPMSLDELKNLGEALLRPTALTELALLLACLALSWLIVLRLKRRYGASLGPFSVLLGRRAVDGLMFPLLALLLAWGASHLLPMMGVPRAVFRLVIPLLIALTLIRLTVRVIAAALPGSALLTLTTRIFSWLAWGASLLWVLGLLPSLLDELDDIQLKVGNSHTSLLDLFQGFFTALIVLVLALWISSAVQARLMRNERLDLSLQKIAANITRAALLFIGLLVALSAAGIDLTALGVLGGAVGVGIGFGLQKLASNYVSGFVILAERSLRIGDMVKVDGFEGRISDIKTRYTVIRALSGRESIVPNELLITQRVENASLADPQVLISSTVVVGYETSLDALFPRLIEAMKQVPRVLSDPGPGVQLSNFAADGLELTLLFWIQDPHNGSGGVRSDVNLAVLRLLGELGVDIPYPQRVIRNA
ncbi:MAG TPA: mechanosensitive ion channel domain-containing protein [Burkholderiaceae bacterium]|jgi:small-conductance mechanosensitive channel